MSYGNMTTPIQIIKVTYDKDAEGFRIPHALNELNTILDGMNIPVETGVFSNKAPDTYVVLTPLIDVFDIYADNRPEVDVQEVRLSLFTKNNYLNRVTDIVVALFNADFTITEKRYIDHEDDTGYHHYAIDVAKHYIFPKEENS